MLTWVSDTDRVDTANVKHPSFTAWTTGVSNPIRYPRFRLSASEPFQQNAFAFGVLADINAFYRYTGNSICLSRPLSLIVFFAVPVLSTRI